MNRKIIDAVGMNFILRFINMFLGIMLTPLLFRMMGREELTGWFLIINNIPFLGLLDFGLTPTLWRRVSLIYGRLAVAKNQRRITYLERRMRQMFATGKRLFEVRSIFAFFISIIGGWFYIHTIRLTPGVQNEIMIGWAVVAVSQAIQIRGSIWSVFLLSTGNAALDVALTIITSTLDLALRFVVVALGGGIIGLAIVTAVFVIARRLLSAWFARRRLPRWVEGKEGFSKTMVASLARPMFSAWLIGLGSFLILRTDQYFIVGLLDPKELPAYQGTLQVFASLSQLALLTGGAAGVFLSHSWAAGKVEAFRTTVGLSLRICLAILWFGIATLMAIGSPFFTLWLNGAFVGYGLMMAFALSTLLNAQTSVLMDADRSTEHEVYGKVVIICGLLNVIITYVLGKMFGLIGIALSTSIAVALTTGWVSAMHAQRRLGIGFFTVVAPVQLMTAVMAAAIYGLIRGANALTGTTVGPPQMTLAVALAIGPPGLMLWIWFGIFSKSQRSGLLRYARDTITRLMMRRGAS